jgi:uncharacterized protein YjbI with pentapeptide repeats
MIRIAVVAGMDNAKPMIRLAYACLRAIAAGLVAAVVGSGAVLAGCTDPPAPGVNWQRCIFDGLDISQADLSGARLRDGSFFRANLTGSNLSKVSAFKAKFVNALMAGAILDEAKLSEADFTKAHLTKASFQGADLRRARFFDAILREADFSNARLDGADFTRADLTGATWADGKRICGEGSIGRCN